MGGLSSFEGGSGLLGDVTQVVEILGKRRESPGISRGDISGASSRRDNVTQD